MLEETEKKNIFSEWLEKLQQESWQLELLISGFALFGIWESKDVLESFSLFLSVNKPVNSESVMVFSVVMIMLNAGWLVFFINLLIHVVLRGLWIGAIGLRYVSGDINYDKLDYSTTFNEYFKQKVGGFDDYIERLEKICSSIFAYTFLLFFIFLSFAFFIVFWIALASLLDYTIGFKDASYSWISILIIAVFLLLAFFVFLDFISLGMFKKIRNKGFSKGYSYIYRFYSLITLSFIYRPLLYNFLDTKYTRRLFWFSIPYLFLITIILPGFILEANPYFPEILEEYRRNSDISSQVIAWNNYDDLREKTLAISGDKRKRIRMISLSNSEVNRNYMSVFIRQIGSDELLLGEKYGIAAYRKSGLRHDFFKGKIQDSTILDYENQKSVALLKLLKLRKKIKKDTVSDSFESNFSKAFNHGRYGSSISNLSDYMEYRSDSIKAVWNDKILKTRKDKMSDIKNKLLEANKVSIDGSPYNDLMSCKFYIHPNMKEKGILCYFPLDSLADGEHILTLERSVYVKALKDSIDTRTISLPFWKY